MKEEKVIVKLKKQALKSEINEMKIRKKHQFLIVLTCAFLFVAGVVVGAYAYSLKNNTENVAVYNKLEEIKKYMNNLWLYKNDYEDLD